MNSALLSSKKMDWCTPQKFYDALNEEFSFVADVAATEQNKKAPFCYTPETDGLKSSWVLGGRYSATRLMEKIGKWVKKAYEEAQKGATVVMLIPARTDTSYFHDYIYGKAEVRFVRGRLKFTDEHGAEQNAAPFPSMVVVFNK